MASDSNQSLDSISPVKIIHTGALRQKQGRGRIKLRQSPRLTFSWPKAASAITIATTLSLFIGCASAQNMPEKEVQSLRKLALKKESSGDIASTVALEERAFKIEEQLEGKHYYNKEGDLYRLRELFIKTGDYASAEKYCRRLIALSEDIYGINSSNVADGLDSLAGILKRVGRSAEAKAAESKAQAIEEGNLNGDITAKKKPIFKPANPQAVDIVLHPVLNSRAGHGLEGKQLNSKVFKDLSALTRVANVNHRSTWTTYFRAAEEEAAQQFCRLAKGMTKAQVEAYAGAPRFRGGKIDCWNCRPGDDIWLYGFGERSVPVSLVFRGDVCVEAKRHSDDLDREYQVWRADQFIKFAKGKTTAQIIAYAGQPSQSQLNGVLSPVNSLSSKKLDFVMGSHTLVGLYMRKGICIAAHKYLIGRQEFL
jgi:tetratricopeptide (TPR) repeat protein